MGKAKFERNKPHCNIGTIAVTTCALPRESVPCTWPRRELRSPMTPPRKSSGVTTSTFMIGSSSFTAPLDASSRNEARAAISKVSALESTS